jgi:hypothetical protein
VNAGTNANDGTTLWVQEKYPDYASPIPIVTGGEAQLILAEVQGGQAAVAGHQRAAGSAFAAALRQHTTNRRSARR